MEERKKRPALSKGAQIMARLAAVLGALLLGLLLASDPKASELSKSLFGFKDLFLVGFFLSIGLTGDPSAETVGIATLLAVLAIFKVGLFFLSPQCSAGYSQYLKRRRKPNRLLPNRTPLGSAARQPTGYTCH